MTVGGWQSQSCYDGDGPTVSCRNPDSQLRLFVYWDAERTRAVPKFPVFHWTVHWSDTFPQNILISTNQSFWTEHSSPQLPASSRNKLQKEGTCLGWPIRLSCKARTENEARKTENFHFYQSCLGRGTALILQKKKSGNPNSALVWIGRSARKCHINH